MKFLELIARVCSALGGLVMVAIMIMTCYSLIGRNFLDHPLIGDFELTAIGCGVAIGLFMPICQLHRENIIVDFFTARMPESVNDKLDRLGFLLMALTGFSAPMARSISLGAGLELIVALIAAVDSFTVSTNPAGDATAHTYSHYPLPAEMTATSVRDSSVRSALTSMRDVAATARDNYVSAADKSRLIDRLAECDDADYFERGVELMIEKDGVHVVPFDIRDLFAVEVDFEDDLTRANAFVEDGNRRRARRIALRGGRQSKRELEMQRLPAGVVRGHVANALLRAVEIRVVDEGAVAAFFLQVGLEAIDTEATDEDHVGGAWQRRLGGAKWQPGRQSRPAGYSTRAPSPDRPGTRSGRNR